MDVDYKTKFDQLRAYIPFLNNMIERLETAGTGNNNPRQAQWKKIKALRDLLLENNKKLKMENLFKCEKVLINLYSKVEQNELTSNEMINAETEDLKSVRQKLMNVTQKLDSPSPSPVCTAASTDQLYQRRPMKNTTSPTKSPMTNNIESDANSKRYTRVLNSPEKEDSNDPSEHSVRPGSPLYHRRSPKPLNCSTPPTAHRKQRKRSAKRNRVRSSTKEDINITLNVPTESLNSLNTKDIFERIMSCRDTDVDIEQLSKLRTKILNELKETGANQDISDLILQSYKKKKNKCKDVEEGELSDSDSDTLDKVYGNLVIELKNESNFINEKTKTILEHTSHSTSSKRDTESRNIKISLILSNLNQDSEHVMKPTKEPDEDHYSFYKPKGNYNTKIKDVTFDVVHANSTCSTPQSMPSTSVSNNRLVKNKNESSITKQPMLNTSVCTNKSNKNIDADSTIKQTTVTTSTCTKTSDKNKNERSTATKQENIKYTANFYKSQNDEENQKAICIKDTLSQFNDKASDQEIKESYNANDTKVRNKKNELENSSNVGTKKEITEIDILKALKNEILNESIDIPNRANTPVLHQPKITKVTKIDGSHKRRISLEKYKEKVSTCANSNRSNPLFIHEPDLRIQDKAQSRGLTEKERERFFGPEISSDSCEEDNTKLDVSVEDMKYSDMAPQSPEKNVIDNPKMYSPIIIPTDPIEATENTLVDTDMRLTSPIPTNTVPKHVRNPILVGNITKPTESMPIHKLNTKSDTKVLSPLKDPRIKDIDQKHSLSYAQNPNPGTSEFATADLDRDISETMKQHSSNTDKPWKRTESQESNFTNDAIWDTSKDLRQSKISTRDPRCGATINDDSSEVRSKDSRCLPQQIIQPRLRIDRDPRLNVDNTTRAECSTNYCGISETSNPSTPSHSFARSDNKPSSQPPAYTPSHLFGRTDTSMTTSHPFGKTDRPMTPSYHLGRTDRPMTPSHSFGRSDTSMTPSHPFGKTDTPMTPSHPFGRTDRPMTPSHTFGRTDAPMTPSHPFGRTDAPMTPSHPFGRTDAPMTPSHPFGRTDTPMTPSHPFGRTDAPMTPSHPFGRTDVPMTPSHRFGRTDAPMTPSHPFGRTDAPMTPSHPFGRTDAPMTPSHPFGRTDAPMTPSHPFGRTDNPSHPYGRNDSRNHGRLDNQSISYNKSECPSTQNLLFSRTGGYNQETRIKMYDDETSDVYGKKHDRSYDSTKRFSTDESRSYRREGSVFRSYNVERQVDSSYENQRRYKGEPSAKSIYNDADYSSRRESSSHDFNRSRREHSVGRVLTYNDRNASEGKHDAYSQMNNHEPSLSNSVKIDELYNRNKFQRSRSVGRTFEKKSDFSTTLAVHSHDRSFNIDTSVNRTFQFPVSGDDGNLGNNFNDRRKRASSVGRFSTHESCITKQLDKYDIKSNDRRFSRARSMGRQTELDTNHVFDNFKNNFGRGSLRVDKRSNYNQDHNERRLSRAQSVGKQITDKTNFKAKSFSINLKKIEPKCQYSPRDDEHFRGHSKSNHETNRRGNKNDDIKINDYRSKKERYEKQQSYNCYDKSNSSSHRRDPRMYRDNRMYFDNRYKKDNRTSRHGSDRSIHGMVYTHDSISKGTILTSSYGVKNYKIPKIKRDLPEEKVDEDSTKGNNESTKDHNTIKVADNVSAVITKDNIENEEKVVAPHKNTPESKPPNNDKNQIFKPSRASRTRTISSDSDSERNDISEKTNEKINSIALEKVFDSNTNIIKKNLNHDKEKASNFDSEEDNRDGDIFNETTINDFPVKSKIDDLIANLDEDLVNTDSNDKLFSVVCNEKIIPNVNLNNLSDKNSQSISSAASDNYSEHKLKDTTSKNVKDVINEYTPNISEEPCLPTIQHENKEAENNQEKDVVQAAKTKEDINVITSTHHLNENNASKEIDTTEFSQKKEQVLSNDIHSLAKSDHDANVVSDSTTTVTKISNNTESITDDVLPDSTEEISVEISSTNESKAEISNEESNRLKTLDTLMSLVQDKSKINELFAMLDGQSEESNKIKRTLEKLSQIVSEDEDTPAKDNNKEINEKFALNSVEDSEQTQCSKLDTEKDLNTTEEVTQDNKDESFSNEDLESQDKCIKSSTETSDFKRVTRARHVQKKTKQPKKRNEVMKLQEDLKDMFMNSQTLSTTGLRMCRLAKLVDENNLANKKSEVLDTSATKAKINKKKNDEASNSEIESCEVTEQHVVKPFKKNANNKIKGKAKVSPKLSKITVKNKPGPKSKKLAINNKQTEDPYDFESDSFIDTTKASGSSFYPTSDSEDESLASLKSLVESELGIESKPKPKRKKCSWKLGIINKLKKKMPNTKVGSNEVPQLGLVSDLTKSNMQCSLDNNNYFFIDKSYCFKKKITHYSCKFCNYEGDEIVFHYKEEHPHIEVPLSRMDKKTADDAMKQCLFTDFKKLQKVVTKRQVCRFCFEVFDKENDNLETFFRHVVSKHTGEYKKTCTKCSDLSNCPITLSIPLPPSNDDGLLLGYICGECNYTQLSLENLKTHVAIRHDNEQTAVYTINIGHMSNKAVNAMVSTLLLSEDLDTSQRTLRSHKNSNTTEETDEHNEEISTGKVTKNKSPVKKKGPSPRSVQSKITFESDVSEGDRDSHNTSTIKSELEESDSNINTQMSSHDDSFDFDDVSEPQSTPKCASENLYIEPHFKINITSTATKEYVCCINGNTHYSHNLLISMKKHVQLKHKEIWDGYCCLCKVIVTPQGKHDFRVCLDHFLDKHMDEFPILENIETPDPDNNTALDEVVSHEKVRSDSTTATKSYINVRPLSELMFNHSPVNTPVEETSDDMALPRIQSVVSLNINETSIENKPEEEILPFINNDLQSVQSNVEEISHEVEQEKIMSQKHQIVLQSMLLPEKLVQIFKCAGHYCSFTTDSPEKALVHASAHQRIGGIGALRCIYCAYSIVNGIDLASHVFREHGQSKYACKLCIYRAASIPSVEYHIGRKHSNISAEDCVLTSSFDPGSNKQLHQPTPLARTDAVPLYMCTKDTALGCCKFRHYTPGKFMEHMRQSHPNEDSFECSFCAKSFSQQLLIDHLREHGLHLYQCVWCVNGFDSETKFLDHISLMHPDRKPSAYLRHIIDNPTGSQGNIPKTKVLPMVTVNNPIVKPIQVPVASNTDSPEKEAERAFDLEQLIGATQVMIENIPDTPPDKTDNTIETVNKSLNNRGVSITLVQKGSECPPVAKDSVENTVSENSCLFDTTIQNVIQPTSLDNNTTLMKVEPNTSNNDVVISPSSDGVICLSDDEQSTEANLQIVDVSDEEQVIPNVTIEVRPDTSQCRYPLNELFKCSKCPIVCKKFYGFGMHIQSCCLSKRQSMKCYYCSYRGTEPEAIIQHYLLEHGSKDLPRCPYCRHIETTKQSLKRHMLDAHGKNKGSSEVHVAFRKIAPKRKPSTGDAGGPAKVRRYGPDDICMLPMNQIFDEGMHCALCQFNTKVRINMLRHLQQHAELGPVASIAPVNPVPLLETNERHFDKMANLAASSNQTRSERSSATASTHAAPPAHPAQSNAILFPQYVPERKRHACGAVGCSYISVDEATLRCHWEALHSGAVVYRCVHCSPSQKLDPSRALTAARIIAHNKMHDERLYACSVCHYYHYQRHLVEKHVLDKHAAGVARVSVVREPVLVDSMLPVTVPPAVPQPSTPPASMDLQPWHCGLCEFGSMLRHDVVNHCGTVHASKFQYRCAFCQYRSSACESVIRHHIASHPGMQGQVFHFFYKEGSLSLEPDGTPLWVRQRREADLAKMTTVIKGDVDEPAASTSTTETTVVAPIDLNLVKTEVVDEPDPLKIAMDVYGQFCDPKGSQFVCPLCKNAVEGSRDDMTAHLYEELNYRKWTCGLCPYKSFSKIRLMEHIRHEHRRTQDPVALPPNEKIELWVSKLLDHQEKIVEENNKINEQSDTVGPSVSLSQRYLLSKLIKEFGPLGNAVKEFFQCPQCKYKHLNKKVFVEHLTQEAASMRFRCSHCDAIFKVGDDTRYHGTKEHHGQASSLIELSKDLEMRKAWIDAVVNTQSEQKETFLKSYSAGQSMCPNTEEDSLLFIRYEEKVPTPELAAGNRRDTTTTENDSDEERLIIDEPTKSHNTPINTPPNHKIMKCPHCPFTTKFKLSLNDHTLRHYKLKPYGCRICNANGYKSQIYKHFKECHPETSPQIKKVEIPTGPPIITSDLSRFREKTSVPVSMTVCLLCESNVPEGVIKDHMASLHPNCEEQFAKKGTVVYKCRACLKLELTLEAIMLHFQKEHPNDELNYSLFKLGSHCAREAVVCIHCNTRFKYAADFRIHLETTHANMKDNTKDCDVINVEEAEESHHATKRKINAETSIEPVRKKTARKSTTKLPKLTARKSTTKLPLLSDCEEFSFYGTKPSLEQYCNVTTKLPFFGTMMPFTLRKLSKTININPKVVVDKSSEEV